MDDFPARCLAEVHRLHDVLRDWLRGTVPRSVDGFAPFATALADPCRVVSPLGTITFRDDLLVEFEGIHGALADHAESFDIRVENAAMLDVRSDRALVTYEEWHDLEGESSARLTTALFVVAPTAPLGVAWSHIHETWLPGRAPAAGERFPIQATG